MKRLSFLAFLFCALSAVAQVSVPISGRATDQQGNPVPYAPIRVCQVNSQGVPCNPTILIYKDVGVSQQIGNPTTADQYGNYLLYAKPQAAPNVLLVQVTVPGHTWSYVVPGASAASSLSIPVDIPSGGTNATTAAGALSNLGGWPGGGQSYAPNFVSGGGNNGISNALIQCGANCSVWAPPSYAITEAQPFGGVFGDPQTTGPKSTDPVAQFMDGRYGVPQWVFNRSKNVDNRHGASPFFVMNWAGDSGLNGTFAHPPMALSLQTNWWTGGRNFYNDKMNAQSLNIVENHYTQIQGGGSMGHTVNCYGNGDCVGLSMDTISYGGPSTLADEGNEGSRIENGEGGQVFSAIVGSIATAADGSVTLSTNTQTAAGTQGEGRLVIDKTKVYNAGYIANIGMSGGNMQWTGSSAANWDATYGTGTQTTLTAAVQNPGTTNSFPQSSAPLSVASTTGFTVGHLACVWDYDYECEQITAVNPGVSITLATVRQPHPSGAYVTTGGLSGYCIESEADRLSPGNQNGVTALPDVGVQQTIRNCIPIMWNSAGNVANLFTGRATLPGNGDKPTTRAYTQMGGVGATCSVTVSGGHITALTASGGSGYIDGNPPQIVLSGITYTTAPVLYATTGGGAVASGTIYSAGAGITGTPTCAVVTSNPYDIYPAAKTYSVYNPTAGAVDGTLYTEPFSGTVAAGDTVEQPHYFDQSSYGDNNHFIGQVIPTTNFGAHNAINYVLTGLWQGNDAGINIYSDSDSSLFSGYPGAPSILGRGQLIPGLYWSMAGAWRHYFSVFQPPFAGSQDVAALNGNGFNPAIGYVGCGALPCSSWSHYYWFYAAQTVAGSAGVRVKPSADSIDLTAPVSASLTEATSGCTVGVANGQFFEGNCAPGVLLSAAWFFSGIEANYAANSNNPSAATWANTDAACTGCSIALTGGQTDPFNGTSGTKMVLTGITSSPFNFQNAVPGGGTTPSPNTTYTSCYVLSGNSGGEVVTIDVGQFGGTAKTLTTTPTLYCTTFTSGATVSAFTTGINFSSNVTIFFYGSCMTPGAQQCMPPSIVTTGTQITTLQSITWSPSLVTQIVAGTGISVSPTNGTGGAVTVSVPGSVTRIAAGTVSLPTTSVSAGTCDAAATTVSATGVLTSDTIDSDFNADPTAISGYGAGQLYVVKFPTADNVNFKRCNGTTGVITPAAATLNWKVTR